MRIQGWDRVDASAARISVATCAAKDSGSRRHELAELGHNVVGCLESVCAVVNSDKTRAATTSSTGQVRAVLGISSKSPSGDTRCPVLERAHSEACDLIPGTGRGGPAFSHVLFDVRVALLKARQDSPVKVAGVAVPRNRV